MKKICRDIIGVLVLGVMIGACSSPLLEEDELLGALNMGEGGYTEITKSVPAAARVDEPDIDLCEGLDASATTLEVDGSDHLIIRDQAGLEAIGDDQNSLEAHYILCDDINLDDTFTQINPDSSADNDPATFEGDEFTGTLEGNHKTILELKIHAENSNFVGLFGKIGATGTLKNLELSLVEGDDSDPSISGKRHVGALTGENEGTITNVRVTGGYIQGESDYIGGLVGSNSDNGTIETSSATGTVEGNYYVGGLVGHNKGTITESSATGTVKGTGSGPARIGGLVGWNDGGTITASYVTGPVEGYINVGGLVGYNDTGTVETSYATGTVEGGSQMGGLVGWNDGGTITASYATGAVERTDASSTYIGGLVGLNNITGIGAITASYFDAATTAQSQFIGNESVEDQDYHTNPADDYVYTEADGAGTLIAQDNFSDWDFTDIWAWQGDGQWPLLQFQDTRDDDSETSEGGNSETSEGDSDALVGLCEGLDASATSVEVDGSDYLIIRNRAELEAIKDDLTAHYILCKDIRFDDLFTQINPDTGNDAATFEGDEFTGTLEGNHRTIHGLRIHAENSNFVGLFGKIGSGGEIRNLRVSLIGGNAATPSISGKYRVGALAGENEGTITNVKITGGYIQGEERYIGGLVGSNNGIIETSSATGTVTGNYYIGGLVGHNDGTVETSYATGTVEGGSNIGGLVGSNSNNGEIKYSYATGSVEGISSIGGLVGSNSNNGAIKYSYATGSVEGTILVGGFVGYYSDIGTTEANYFDAELTGQVGTGTAYHTNPADDYVYTEADGAGTLIAQDDFPDWDFTDIWTWQEDGQWPLLQFQDGSSNNAANSGGDDSNIYLGLCEGLDASATSVEVDGSDHLIIRNRGGLRAIKDDLTAHYILCNDIRLDGTFMQINPDTGNDAATFEGDEFTGTLEGNHRAIHGLRIRAENSNFVGLFGKIGSGGEIRNLRVSLIAGDAATPSISGKHRVGALAGESEGTITNVRITGGYIQGEERYIGGLVGSNNGIIETSSATGTVTGNYYIGGLVGHNDGTITSSSATGSVAGTGSGRGVRIGGLVGYNDTGTVETSYATGTVEGGSSIGGLVGSNSNNGEIKYSYATGSVEGVSSIGGLAGSNSNNGEIKYSYATGSVEGTILVGGFVGYYSDIGTTEANYFDAELTGQVGTGTAYHTNPADDYVYTEADGVGTLIAQDNFPDWDFTDIWTWQEDGQWPLLQFQDTRDDDSETSYADSDILAPLGLCVGVDSSATTLEVDGSDYLIIRDQAGLEAIGDDQNSLEAHYILCNDISLEGTFTQINPDTGNDAATFEGDEFTGTLKGNHRTIHGLKIHAASSNFVGLFGKIGATGTLKNLELSLVEGDDSDPSISGKRHVGALTGENEGTITNVRVTGGYIQGEIRYIGGLVGSNSDNGIIETSSATSAVEGGDYTGGLVGHNEGAITESYATGKITGGDYVGGLIGYNKETITDIYATGKVSGSSYVGGLVGSHEFGRIVNSYATGWVHATGWVYASGWGRVGPLVGSGSGSRTVTDSYFDATTTGQRSFAQSATPYYMYYDNARVYTAAYGRGSMITQSNFSSWDFDTVWAWRGEGMWPLLQFQDISDDDSEGDEFTNPIWNQPYDKTVFKTSHNSYEKGLIAQLDDGIRGIEFDIWDREFEDHDQQYRIGHSEPGDAVHGDHDDDFSTPALEADRFSDWLDMVNGWSDENQGHAPLTITLDLKSNMTDNSGFEGGNYARLNHTLLSAFGSKLYTADTLRTGAWPTVGELRDKIIVVLSSAQNSNRERYVWQKGKAPAIAMNDSGQIIVVHESRDTNNLWYWTGQLQSNGLIHWKQHENYDTGKNPAIALNNDGYFVEVHKESGDSNNLYYNSGKLEGSDFLLELGNTNGTKYDTGKTPAIALNDDELFVEVHRGNNDVLYYKTGRLLANTSTKTLEFLASGRYADGVEPGVRFTHLSERTVEAGHRDADSRDMRVSGVVGEDYSIAFSSLEVATDLVASKDTALSDAGHIRAEVSDTYLEYQHIDQEAYSLALGDRQIGWRQVAFVEADRRNLAYQPDSVLSLLAYRKGISYARFFASPNFSKTVYFRGMGYITRDWDYSEDDKQDSLDELPQFPSADAPLPDWYHDMFDELGYVE